jgi:zinc protease
MRRLLPRSGSRTFTLAFVALAAATVASAQVAEWPSERPPRPLAAHPVSFPPYQVRTLSNGLQVIAISHHEQPAVSLRLIVRAGGAQDPVANPGVAYVAASLLDQGTTTKSAEQIASTIDSIGGAIASGALRDLTFINAAVMKDSLGLALDLVSELVRNPAFAKEEIERQRQQILSGFKVSYDDPTYLARVVFDRLVYGFHPYGKPDSGTPTSISAVTREDLIAFHKRWFGANNAILAVVGDVTPEEAFAGAERAFGAWGRVELPQNKVDDPPPPARRVVIIDRPGAVQTEIRVGNIGLARRHPDYLALDIATKILGGEGGNRLHRVLRSERSLTYGASADLNALKDTGDIVAETNTRLDQTGEALRVMVDEIARLQRQRVQTRELNDAQEYLTGSFPLTIETPSAIALQVLNAVFYGLNLSDLQTYRERVNQVTVDDIQRVAQQYLRPDRLSIVLVGDASGFAKQLAGVGFDQVERIAISELDLASPDLRRHTNQGPGRIEPAAFRSQAAPAAASEARDLVARAVAAKGGLELLRSIHTVKASATMTVLDGPAGRLDIQTTTSITYPGGFRIDAQTPAGPLVQAFSNGEFWVDEGRRGPHVAPPAFAEEMRGNVQRDAVPMLLALADGKLSATRLPDVVEGGRALKVLEIKGAGMRPVSVMFDSESALIVRQRFVVSPIGPDAAVTEEAFSDYRDVNGLKVAFRAMVYRNGAPVLERVLHSFEVNVPLASTLFSKSG